MGSFGVDRDLFKAGYEGLKDPLSKSEKEAIVAFNNSMAARVEELLLDSDELDLEAAEKAIKDDVEAIVSPWFVVRDSVFSVLNMQGEPEIIDRDVFRREAKKRKERIDDARHERLMREDPEYAEEYEIKMKEFMGMGYRPPLCKED